MHFIAVGRLIRSSKVPPSVVGLLTNCEYPWLDINTCMLGSESRSTLKSPKMTLGI